jgi:alpha-glucosidase
VAIIGAGLGTIVESVLIESLNPPSEIADTSWIVPGRVAFPWWSDHFANGKPETLRAFVDLAAEMDWEWLEFDLPLIRSAYDPVPGWRKTPWIQELVAYAFSKGVR